MIAGHLLLLAPEEDAFWIFVTLMDAYLRPYFSPNTPQLEVDAALFCRALESNDSQVAKKILTEIGIGAVELCRPWFTTLFVDALPSEYVNRVWDFFLCEGKHSNDQVHCNSHQDRSGCVVAVPGTYDFPEHGISCS